MDIVQSILSKNIITFIDSQFARHGIPGSLRTDNGSNLVSGEMGGYLREMGVKLKLTTPLWPRANGEIERPNRSLLKATRGKTGEWNAINIYWHIESHHILQPGRVLRCCHTIEI